MSDRKPETYACIQAWDRIAEIHPIARKVTLETIEQLTNRIAALEARLDAVRNCKRYLCEFPDIGKISGAYRARDIDAALEQDDD